VAGVAAGIGVVAWHPETTRSRGSFDLGQRQQADWETLPTSRSATLTALGS
jgi:hypothetical protein